MENNKLENPTYKIRRKNLQKCVDDAGGRPIDFLEKYGHLYSEAGTSPSYLSQLLSGKAPIGNNTAKRLEEILGKPRYWFDTDHSKENIVSLEDKNVPKDFNSVDKFDIAMALIQDMNEEDLDEIINFLVIRKKHDKKKKSSN